MRLGSFVALGMAAVGAAARDRRPRGREVRRPRRQCLHDRLHVERGALRVHLRRISGEEEPASPAPKQPVMSMDHHQGDAGLPEFGAKPWAIRFHGTTEDEATRTLINPFDGSSRDVQLPMVVGKTCLRCFGGWALMLDEDTKDCFLLDLASLSTVSLPPLLPSWPRLRPLVSARRAPVTARWSSSSRTATISSSTAPGDAEWSKFSADGDCFLRPMHGSHGRIYVTSSLDWELVVINMDSPSGVHVAGRSCDEDAPCVPKAYEVFLLRINLCGMKSLGSRDLDIHRFDPSNLSFELVESIGNRTIFASMDSVMVSSATAAGTEPDCVYFLYPLVSDGLRLYTIRLRERTVSFRLVPTESQALLYWAIPQSFRLELEPPKSLDVSTIVLCGAPSSKLSQCDKFHLFSPMTAKEYNLTQEKGLFSGDKLLVLFSKFGWVLITEGCTSVTALNPFTKESLSLPPTSCLFSGISFSSVPTSSDSVVLMLYKLQHKVDLLVWHAGDEDWTSLDFEVDANEFDLTYNDPVFFEEEFYCLGRLGNLAVFNPLTIEWRVLDKPGCIYKDEGPRRDDYRGHILEFSGDLVAVFVPQHNGFIEMFKLDRSEMAWTKLERMDDATMFVDNWGATIVPQSEDNLCNRIYLPKYGVGEDEYAKVSAYYDLVSQQYHPTFYGLMEPMNSIWVEPNLKHDSSS
ncbi:hypothetical protein ACP70R_042300 [Stipagrostis hirtigluma subsp. patula]